MKSVMKHNFSQVPQANIQRSSFNRSHGYKTTFDGGYLVPVFVDEVLPGDTFNLKMTSFARLATPETPFMDNLFLDSFFFFVPLRLIWTNAPKFFGEQEDPGDSTDYTTPKMAMPSGTGAVVGSLSDYMGIPTEVPDLEVVAFHHRAYNLIYNEWFRDENLIDSVVVDKGDGPDTYTDYVLLRRGKRHDYFTSCLPWLQKGTAVTLPIGDTAPVVSTGDNPTISSETGPGTYVLNTGLMYRNGSYMDAYADITSDDTIIWGDETGMETDLSNAVAGTVNQFRLAFQLQKYYERDARGGTRYTEKIQAHFGVVSPDARLQRPEYLGGGSTPVNVHPVAQTSQSDTTAQGTLAAYGTATAHGHGFTKSFTEHGVIIGMVSVRADLTYQQGLNKMFSRDTALDYYWPSFSHIGEQAVLMQEIYAVDPATDTDADGTPDNEEVFGYQERYAEYRYKPSLITGAFRSTYATSLDVWHLSQEFSSAPTLNQTFIEDNPPIDRVIAVPTEPHFLFDAYFDLKCVRPMPVYSVPGLVDHF
jgi:hypothetical protein